MENHKSFRRQATAAVVWSSIQNWGSRALGLLVFILLARLLDPHQYGVAASAFLILSLLMLIAESGLGDALVQRRDLTSDDANGPFFLSLTLSICLSAATFFFADDIARLMSIEEGSRYIAVTGLLSPFLMLSGFQEAMYRREMMFRALTVRGLVGLSVGGIVGVVMAIEGWGPWAVIAQYGSQVILNTIWIWLRPVWVPKLNFNYKTTRELVGFGLNLVVQRFIDFATVRSVSFIILAFHGAAALALFNVASRITYILLELLQGSVSNASTVILSKISNDIDQMQRLYIRVCSLVATFGTPIFFVLAATTPEVNAILFGQRWSGAEAVMQPMLMLGGIYCVQFINGAYLIALGKPRTFMWLMVLKAAAVLPPLYFIKMDSMVATVWLYCACLLVETPFMFHFTIKALSLRWPSLAKPLGIPLCVALASLAIAEYARVFTGGGMLTPYVTAVIQGGIFALAYASLTFILNLDNLRANIAFLKNRIRRA